MAFAGWYIQKKNWLSVLIFAPVFLFLGNTIFLDGKEAIKHFPHLIIATIFCILQILLYVYVFFPKKSQKAVGLALPIIMVVVMMIFSPQVASSYQLLKAIKGDRHLIRHFVTPFASADAPLCQREG